MHFLVAVQTFWLWDYRYAIENVANDLGCRSDILAGGITDMLLKMLLMKWCCFISKFFFCFLTSLL
jgi:hypothetical protein